MFSRAAVSVSASSSAAADASPFLFPPNISQFSRQANIKVPRFLGNKKLPSLNCRTIGWRRSNSRPKSGRMESFTARAAAQPLKNANELIDSVETFIFDCDGDDQYSFSCFFLFWVVNWLIYFVTDEIVF